MNVNVSLPPVLPAGQDALAAHLYRTHQSGLDAFWNEDGTFRSEETPVAPGNGPGGFRASLWHCLAFLDGDERCVARASRIIEAQRWSGLCHFSPGAAVDVLFHHRDKLTPGSRDILERYLVAILPQMATEDLRIHGYNDNHPYKAIHALVLGGEMADEPHLVELGLRRLRGAIEVFERSGFPCEYNSPNYAPVSLQPLAAVAGESRNEEARELALRLERFYWQDVALHFDPRAGVCTGPMSRAGSGDYGGLLNGTLVLLHHLFPERFALNLIEEMFVRPQGNPHITPFSTATRDRLSFYQAHIIWYARSRYHLTPALVEAIFEKPAGASIKGMAEGGTSTLTWKTPDLRPAGAPDDPVFGPRRALLTTYFGERYSLGTAQYSWLDNAQAHGFFATLARQPAGDAVRGPANAVVYFARHFFDEEYPYADDPTPSSCFMDHGVIRTVQHRNTAMVFYHPRPRQAMVKRLRTGVFRPLAFSRPVEVWIGKTKAPSLNLLHGSPAPVAIHEGDHYVGIIPLPLSAGQENCREAFLHVQTAAEHLSILISTRETWSPEAMSYRELMESHSGFVFEIHPASDFASFAAFRQWLAAASVSDRYHALMRTTTYEREGLRLSASYSPWESAFRYASVNHAPLSEPVLSIDGMPDPGEGLNLPAHLH